MSTCSKLSKSVNFRLFADFCVDLFSGYFLLIVSFSTVDIVG